MAAQKDPIVGLRARLSLHWRYIKIALRKYVIKQNNAARFSKSRFTVLHSGKNSFNYHETRTVERVHFDVE